MTVKDKIAELNDKYMEWTTMQLEMILGLLEHDRVKLEALEKRIEVLEKK